MAININIPCLRALLDSRTVSYILGLCPKLLSDPRKDCQYSILSKTVSQKIEKRNEYDCKEDVNWF